MAAVDPTIKRGSGNFLSSDSTTLTLFNVQSEVIKKSAGLIQLSFPFKDSSAAILGDLTGASRTVIIDGTFTTINVEDAFKFVRDLVSIKTIHAETLIDGAQGGTGGSPAKVGYTYTPVVLNFSSTGQLDDPSGDAQKETFMVFVNDASVTFTQGNPNIVKYSLTLFEGDEATSIGAGD